MLNNITLFICLIFSQQSVLAEVYRSEGEDGVVEFSNIKPTKQTYKKQTIIYSYSDDNQAGDEDITVFTDQKPTHISSYEVLKFDCFACNPHSSIDWHKVKLNLTAYSEAVNSAATKNHIDPALVRALIHAESAFNAKAESRKGAQGLMQLMPATAKELGVKNALNPKQNINGGVKYLAQLLKTFNGDITLATAAYNAGPNAVKKYNGVPPYQETQVYVERVDILHQRYKSSS